MHKWNTSWYILIHEKKLTRKINLNFKDIIQSLKIIRKYYCIFFLLFFERSFPPEYIFIVCYFSQKDQRFFIIYNIILRDRDAREIREWKISGSFRIKFSRDTFLPSVPIVFSNGEINTMHVSWNEFKATDKNFTIRGKVKKKKKNGMIPRLININKSTNKNE